MTRPRRRVRRAAAPVPDRDREVESLSARVAALEAEVGRLAALCAAITPNVTPNVMPDGGIDAHLHAELARLFPAGPRAGQGAR